MKRITRKHIEKAIKLTTKRWSRMAKAKDRDEMLRIMDSVECGFCTLSTATTYGGCLHNTCPINKIDLGTSCCRAYDAYNHTRGLTIIKKEARRLVKQMKAFDISAIVRTINKAIKEHTR